MPTVSRRTWFMGGAALVVLLAFYLPTLQTIPNGSEHYYMIDVGETQIVLNTWGTLHATGYPLFVMAGNILVTLLRGLGMAAVTAPAVVALVWGLAALALFYALAAHLTGRPALAAGMVILLGLTRTVWIHHVIAEIYTFGLLFLAALLLLALWKPPVRGRVYWLALLGGIAVFHHRALLMAAPALVFAVWREIFPAASASAGKRYGMVMRTLVIALLLGLLGFLPYAYLPLRASAGAEWVYGQPGTWTGFWDQFTGREAERFIGAPDSLDGLLANFSTVNTVLLTDLTLPGLAVGILGLVLALRNPSRRRAALVFLLNGGVAYAFHVLLYTDVLSALILPVIVSVAFGWLFLAEMVLSLPVHPHHVTPSSQEAVGAHSGAPLRENKSFISKGIDWLYGQPDPQELPERDRNRVLIRVWGTVAVILAGLLLGAVLRWQNQ
ncbi:MAG: DUF2723 domain-containing protein, partial [Anaerolineae bacterium]|nr:DUF2723 domain-containing protein [Anaerolineae bacterium]